MKRLVCLGMAVILLACSDRMLGPDDPAYEDICVFYEAHDPSGKTEFKLTRAALDRCSHIEVWVIDFEGAS